MGKYVIYLGLAAAAYWYWSGPYQEARPQQTLEQHLKENRMIMHRCTSGENAMAGSAGLAGIGGMADNSQERCAEKHNLYLKGGEWHSRNAGTY